MDKGLLSDATSTDDGPVSGYMLKEIARGTIASYPACTQLIDFLGTRIKKNNRNVKYKCCVIIKHVCREGRVEFKREVSRILDSIKECLQYKGEVDALRGDEPNRQVREAAKEALDAIFDSQMPVTVSSVAAANRIQAFGGGYEEPAVSSSSAGTGGTSTSYFKSLSSKMNSILTDDGAAYVGHPGATDMNTGVISGSGPSSNFSGSYNAGGSGTSSSYNVPRSNSGGMQGFGNGPDPRDEKSWMQKISDAAATAKASVSSLATSSPTEPTVRFANQQAESSPYSGYASNRGPNAQGRGNTYAPSSASHFSGASSGSWGAGNPGGPPDRADEPPAPGSGGMVPELPLRPGYGRAGSAAIDGSYEQGVIAGLCEPGGMKVVPPEDKLAVFLNSAPTLSADVVGSCLLAQLNEDAWQTRVKALIVISSLAGTKGCGNHVAWWSDPDRTAELFTINQSDSKTSVRAQASKTLRALGVDSGATAPPVSSSNVRVPASQSSQKQVSLIDDDFDSIVAAPPTNHSSFEFDPMIIRSEASQRSAEPQHMMYPPAPPVSTIPLPVSGEGGLFDGMDIGVGHAAVVNPYHTPPAPPASAPAPAAPASLPPGINLLDGMDPFASIAEPSQSVPPSTHENSNIFNLDGMNLMDSHAPVTAASKSSSMFADLEPTFGGQNGHRSAAAPSTGMYPIAGGGYPSSPPGPNSQYPAQAYQQQPPIQQYMSRPVQPAPAAYGAPYPVAPRYPAGAAPLARGYQLGAMGGPSAVRKVIPGEENMGQSGTAAGGSGFSFMSGSKSGTGDSFSFVNDVIKSSTGPKK